MKVKQKSSEVKREKGFCCGPPFMELFIRARNAGSQTISFRTRPSTWSKNAEAKREPISGGR